MAEAKQLPSGSWRVRLFVGHKPDGTRDYMSFTADTKKEAEYLAAAYAFKKKEKSKPKNWTVGEMIDNFIKSISNIHSPNTIREYKSERKNRFRALMNVKLGDLTNEMIQNAINEDAENVSPKTIKNAYGLLVKSLSRYYKDFEPDVDLPAAVRTDIVLPSDEMIRKALELSKGTGTDTGIFLAAFLGLRRSEICALTWDDIDFANNLVRVNKSMLQQEDNSFVLKKKTKTYLSTRYVEAPSLVMKHLSSLERKGEYLVSYSPDNLTNRWCRLRKRCGFYCRLHDLRHYTASIMKAVGMPDKNAAEVMGHSTTNMLKRVYQHPLQAVREEKMKQLHTYFEDKFDKDDEDT